MVIFHWSLLDGKMVVIKRRKKRKKSTGNITKNVCMSVIQYRNVDVSIYQNIGEKLNKKNNFGKKNEPRNEKTNCHSAPINVFFFSFSFFIPLAHKSIKFTIKISNNKIWYLMVGKLAHFFCVCSTDCESLNQFNTIASG